MLYLTTHSTNFIYSYITSDIPRKAFIFFILHLRNHEFYLYIHMGKPVYTLQSSTRQDFDTNNVVLPFLFMCNILPVILTSCLSYLHPACRTYILPVVLTSCLSYSHPACHTHILPVVLTSCLSYSHPACHTHILPVILTSCLSY